MITGLTIGDRQIGVGQPVYVVAELSANHNQDFDQAIRLIEAAKEAGADAVKVQTYTPDTITIRSDREFFQIRGGTLWDGRTLYELYGEACTPWDWQPKLKQVADDLKLDFFSSAFDSTAVDFLESMGGTGIQARILRTNRHSASSENIAHWQTTNHLDGHGDH